MTTSPQIPQPTRSNGISSATIRLIVEVLTLLVIVGGMIEGYATLKTQTAYDEKAIEELKHDTVQQDSFREFQRDIDGRLQRIENLLDGESAKH